MHEFVPPYPERPQQPLSAFATLRLARRNFLAIWEDRCFEWEVFSSRMLSRSLFVCNSPDTVASAFVEHHDSFERKSPQMRHGLAPLLGDGLFISDGETWRRRRRDRRADRPCLAYAAVRSADGAGRRRDRRTLGERCATGAPINALTEMATLTAEIICRTVFGRQLGAAHAAEIIAAFSEYQRLVGQLDLAYFFGLPDWLPRFHSPAIHRAAKRIHRVLDQVIRDCRERLSGGEASMIRLLLEARDPETGEPLDDVGVAQRGGGDLYGRATRRRQIRWPGPGTCCRRRRRSRSGFTPSSRKCSAAARRPSTMFPSWPIRARYSKRRSGSTLRSRCSPGRRRATRRSAAGRVPAGSLVMVVPVAAPPAPQILGQARPLHPRAVSARERPVPRPARLSSVQRRTAHLRRRRLRPDRGDPLHRHAWLSAPGCAWRPDAVVAPVCRLTLRPGDDLRMLVERRD